ncbi:hypothetical protein NDU88_008297 [Pleurodeles waltl]|uniref:Uncharacterized protein n=1 Tax=Pleurodeles waltl TaxID=8319 RepID=A0AAV7RXK7_PLEWA|nr:hypothetical protein NDU88_008297 [Pleurodeles waltl]
MTIAILEEHGGQLRSGPASSPGGTEAYGGLHRLTPALGSRGAVALQLGFSESKDGGGDSGRASGCSGGD